MLVKSLWVSGSLSRLEEACMRSWVKAGYAFDLYVYEPPPTVPKGVRVLDGRSILPEEMIFKYNLPKRKGGGSYSGFSNFFRYKLLQQGGTWVDTDMFCLKPLPEVEYLFVAEDTELAASCIMRVPPHSWFAEFCWNICEQKNPNELVWGETGPQLVSKAVVECNLEQYIQPRDLFFPVMYEEVERFLKDEALPLTFTVHFWNEMWRRRNIDKNVVYDSNTLYERLIIHSISPRFL